MIIRPLDAKNMLEIIQTPAFYKICLFPKPTQSLLSTFKITSSISIANPFSQQGLLLCLEGFVCASIQDSFISAARVFG